MAAMQPPLPDFRFCDNGMPGATARVEDAYAYLIAARDQLVAFYETTTLPAHGWQYLADDYDRAIREWRHTVSIELGTRHELGLRWVLVERVCGEVVKVEVPDVEHQSFLDVVPLAQAMAAAYRARYWPVGHCGIIHVRDSATVSP